MKRIVFFVLLLLAALPAAAQTQKGYVKTRGRLGANGALVPGTRLAGAFVKFRGRQGVRSNARGDFSLSVDKNFYLERAEKQGYELVDRDALTRRYDYSAGTPLVVVMERPEVQQQERLDAERKIRRTLRQQLARREAELDRLSEEQRITQARYDSLYQALYDEQSRNEQLIADMAARYASIDFDQESELNRRIQACILEGDLVAADSLLRTKGDISERIGRLERQESLNAAEAKELERRQTRLERSRQLAAHDREEIAADCYSRHLIFLHESLTDSAAYYIKLRAALDTTNVQWAIDAADFFVRHTAVAAAALPYCRRALRQARAQYGEHHPLTAVAYMSSGRAWLATRKYAEAMVCDSLALGIYKSAYGERHPEVARCIADMGAVYQEQGFSLEALWYYYLALGVFRSAYGERHTDVAMCYGRLAELLGSTGDYAKAMANDSLALGIYKSVCAGGHPDMARCYYHLGEMYNRQHRYDEALSCLFSALSAYKKVYGDVHITVSRCHLAIADVYFGQGLDDEAMKSFSSAEAISMFTGYYSDFVLLDCYVGEATVYLRHGRYDAALEKLEKALSDYGKRMLPSNPRIVHARRLRTFVRVMINWAK